jgi:hypothetical protein
LPRKILFLGNLSSLARAFLVLFIFFRRLNLELPQDLKAWLHQDSVMLGPGRILLSCLLLIFSLGGLFPLSTPPLYKMIHSGNIIQVSMKIHKEYQ